MTALRPSAKLVSDAGWSFAGNVASLLLSVVTVRLLTRMVHTADYGAASLVLGLIALINAFLVGPMMVAHQRLFFDYRAQGLGEWFKRTFQPLLVAGGALAFLLYCTLGLGYSLSGQPLYLRLALPVLVLSLLQPYQTAVANYLEAARRQKSLAVMNVTLKAAYPVLALILLGAQVNASFSLVLGQAGGVALAVLLFRAPRDAENATDTSAAERPDRASLWSRIRAFGWPTAVAYTAMWFITTSDRYVIAHFRTLPEVGVYSVNYGLWSVLFTALSGWLEVLTRPLLYSRAAASDARGVMRIAGVRASLGFMASIALTGVLWLFHGLIVGSLLAPQYRASITLMLVLTSAHWFLVIGYSLISVFLALKLTRPMMYCTVATAAVNVAVNFVIVPTWGIMGAAAATLLTYIVWCALLAIGLVVGSMHALRGAAREPSEKGA